MTKNKIDARLEQCKAEGRKALKTAPKHDTKICYPSIAAVTAEMGGFLFKEAPCRECRKRGSWKCSSSLMNGGG